MPPNQHTGAHVFALARSVTISIEPTGKVAVTAEIAGIEGLCGGVIGEAGATYAPTNFLGTPAATLAYTFGALVYLAIFDAMTRRQRACEDEDRKAQERVALAIAEAAAKAKP